MHFFIFIFFDMSKQEERKRLQASKTLVQSKGQCQLPIRKEPTESQ
jgi:hypothetical protein